MDYQMKMKLTRWLKEPFVTYVILAVTVLIFLGMEVTGGSESIYVLIKWGALYRQNVIDMHEYWRLVTPIFLHIGWMHLILNMITLYFIGQQLENVVGHWRFLCIYLLGGVTGNMLSLALGSPNSISAGASTSIFGLFGAMILIGQHFKDHPAIAYMVRQYAIFILLNLMFNLFGSSVDVLGHVGGLIGGVLAAYVFAVPGNTRRFSMQGRILSGVILGAIYVACLWIGFQKYGFLG